MKLKLLWLLAVATTAMAQGPNDSGDYYMNADGLKGQKLKTALSGIINKHTDIGYAGLWNAYKTTDRRPDGFLRDWYSNATSYVIGGPNQGANYSEEGDSYNREHLVPQSWFSKTGHMRNDAFHVVPTDGYVNNRRGDLPFGEVGTVSYHSANNYSLVGRCKVAGYSGQCFEPNDEIKGDVARAYFYMTTCYENDLPTWGGTNFSYCFDGTTYPALTDWFLQMLLQWSERDPVDEVELERNEAVAALQKNRNPFIDYPGLEQYIWGSKQNEPFDYTMQPGGETATVRKPYFTPTGGIFAEALTVTIVSPTDGATIYYTSDGTTPTTSSTVYTAPITIEETTTLKAIAAKDDAVSHVAVATYVIKGGEQPAEGECIWSEDFDGIGNKVPVEQVQNAKAIYYGDDGQYCLVYDGNMAGGEAPELLIPKKSRPVNYFTALVAMSGQKGPFHLSFLSNRSSIAVSSKTAGVKIEPLEAEDNTYHYSVSVPIGLKSFELTFTMTEDQNARVDNFLLTGPGDDTDGIHELTPTPNASQKSKGTGAVYNLSGQKVSTSQHHNISALPKGVYIVNGKKIIQ